MRRGSGLLWSSGVTRRSHRLSPCSAGELRLDGEGFQQAFESESSTAKKPLVETSHHSTETLVQADPARRPAAEEIILMKDTFRLFPVWRARKRWNWLISDSLNAQKAIPVFKRLLFLSLITLDDQEPLSPWEPL